MFLKIENKIRSFIVQTLMMKFNQSNIVHRTLQELVEHYSKDSDGLCVNLCKPCVQVNMIFRFRILTQSFTFDSILIFRFAFANFTTNLL